MEEAGKPARELLAGRDELAALEPNPPRVAVCDDGAAAILASAWPAAQLVRVDAPSAADALRLGAAKLADGGAVLMSL